MYGSKWWRRGGSNSRPSHCERDTLPAELRPHGDGMLNRNLLFGKRKSGCAIEAAQITQVIEHGCRPCKILIACVLVDGHESFNPVSYTHLTLPTNREV